MIDEGQKVGSSFQGDLNRAGKVKVRHDSIFCHGKKYKKVKTKQKIPKDPFAVSHTKLENSADFVSQANDGGGSGYYHNGLFTLKSQREETKESRRERFI